MSRPDCVSRPSVMTSPRWNSLRRVRTVAMIMAVVIGSGMAACAEGGGPTASGPHVGGTWVGVWQGADVRLSLQQAGNTVSGQLRLGPANYVVRGEVDAQGEVQWATDLHQGNCTSVASRGMQLRDQANMLEGVMRRSQRPRPCGSTGRTSVMQATAELERAF